MTGLAAFLNNALLSIGSCNSGNAAPANGPGSAPFAEECWANTAGAPANIPFAYYDGAQWVTVGALNATAHTWTPYFGANPTIETAPLSGVLSSGVLTLALQYDANFTNNGSNQLALTPVASGNLLANGTGSSAEPTGTTPSAWLNQWCSSAQYNFPQRGVVSWACGTISGLLIAGTGISLSGTGQVTITVNTGASLNWTAAQTISATTVPQLTLANPSADSAALQIGGPTHTVQVNETTGGGVLKTVTNGELALGTNNATRFHVSAAGGLYADGVTGGDEGNGKINATALFAGGNPLQTTAGALGQLLIGQGASAAPTWSTATYPADVSTAGSILNSSAAHTIVATATPTLGVAGGQVGSIAFANATSGTITLQPATGALGSSVATLPANTGIVAELNLGQNWLATQTFLSTLQISGAALVSNGNIAAPAWTTGGIRYANAAATLTDTTSTGTVAAAYTSVAGGDTIAASNAVTYTNYYSWYFRAPTAGSNVALANNWALGADNLYVNGAILSGVAGSRVGSIGFQNATSGTETIQPATGALGSGVATLPAGTYNIVGDSLAQTLTNKTINGGTLSGTIAGTPSLSGANFVANSNLAQMAANTVKGNPTGSTASAQDVSPATARSSSLLNIDACTSPGSAAYIILSTDRCLYHTSLTGAVIDTLPAASSVNAGQRLYVVDFRGAASATNAVTLQRSGSDTINGSASAVAINSQYGWSVWMSDGVSRWTYQQGGGGGGGAGTVTSVGIAAGPTISVSGTCAITTSGTCTINGRTYQYFVITSSNSAWNIASNFGYTPSELNIELWGGGASGSGQNGGTTASRGSGGGAGQYGFKIYTGTMDTTLNVSIGAGGTACSSSCGGVGGGGTSIVGTNLGTVSVSGGSGSGCSGGSCAGGPGGATSSGTTFSIPGGGGSAQPGVAGVFGAGGDSPRGGIGGKVNVAQPGGCPGGGGSGENHTGGGSGAGCAGEVIIWGR